MLVIEKMALLRYLKPADGLPVPKGPLTSSISAQAIAEANKEVQKAMGQRSMTGRNVGATRSILPLNAWKLASIAVNTVQLQQHDIFQTS